MNKKLSYVFDYNSNHLITQHPKFLDTVFRSLVVFIFFPFLLFETSPFKRFSASVLIQSTYIGPEDQSVSQTVWPDG